MEPGRVQSRVYGFGRFELDAELGVLRKAGRKLNVAPQPLQVLQVLLEHPQEVVTRDELRLRIWPQDIFVDYDLALKKAVNRLREVLGDSAEAPRFIQTLPRRGYRFISAVEYRNSSVDELTISGPQTNGDEHKPTRLRALKWIVAAGAIAILILGVSKIISVYRSRDDQDQLAIHSIAVLPLANTSADSSQDYFVDGMTDALITDLAKISSIRIISRTSVMQYKTAKKPLPEIARELNVDAIVEGTVTRSGKRVRIDAQLLRATDDRHLWAEAYERDMTDVLSLQDEVAGAIAQKIQAKISGSNSGRATARPVNPEAYEFYLRARYEWNQRTEAGMNKALTFFDQAIALDPSYAPAYAGLSETYLLLPYYGAVAPTDAIPRGKAAAIRALDLDETLAEAHNAVAYVKFRFDRDASSADYEFRRAIEMNPNYATAREWYALMLADEGQNAKAETEIQRAEELDPLSAPISADHALVMYYGRRYDQASEYCQRALKLHPDFYRLHWVSGLLSEQKGANGEAISEFKRALALSHESPVVLASLGHAYASAGDRTSAHRIQDQLNQQSPRRYVSAYFSALIKVGSGANAEALKFLQRSCDERYVDFVSLNVDHRFDPIHSDGRFQSLLRCAGLPR
jgi:TolB-like protein/DNA-binding winged helix-turn-helix (wHTH) protein/Tfp pilus assembly protein PilF